MKQTKWKIAFLLLLGINLLFAIIIISLITAPGDSKKISKINTPTNDHVSFHVKSNKYDLNRLINNYLKEEAADSPIDYRVLLGDEVELYGTLPFFSEKLNLKLTFEPIAQKNGDLVLEQKSMSIGKLHLPISSVLNIISENYKLPNGVEIRPNDHLVYVHMQQLKLKSDLQIKANKFDLTKDDIGFTILVPVK
ncbi:YpmS family protein [Neobacillus sp. OS1-2]|uniref:YpmS family protein n=1 Tax=Neobacillus sp. OS1-2 TaxID=3070680 RepID=UPI0027E03480|nr:YpmS family protein [Neobacillus sp. OS1-2]WML40242.1 YpmS family protein [Neobacillus sp. OS1-2]